MRIIDAHLHFSNILSFRDAAADISRVAYTAAGLRAEQTRCGIVAGIGMGLSETVPGGFPDELAATPMGLDLEPDWPEGMHACVGINPIDLRRRGGAAAHALAASLENPRVVGIKLYAGYYPFTISDEVYNPVYRLAEEHGLPIVVHGGVTYSERGLLRYSHPLSFDGAIVRHRSLTFVICHMGEPWVMDTAALMSKSPNVMADLSGLLVTDADTIRRKSVQPEERMRLRQPLLFEERPDRWLFGSDWPLAPLEAYVAFIRQLVPEAWHEDVFFRNALRVFPRLRVPEIHP
jgi:predicted TIM-barrel fold metal-dependent hydrolase